MKLHCRGSPGGKGSGGLAACEGEGAVHRVGVEVAKVSDGGGCAERADDARPVPAFTAKNRIVEPDADPCRHFAPSDDRGEQRCARATVAFRDGKRRRHDFRRDMGQRRTMNVAHRHGRDQVAVHQRRAGKRHVRAADDRTFRRGTERRRHRPELMCFLSPVAGKRAGKGIGQKGFGGHLHVVRNIADVQCSREFRQSFRRSLGHRRPSPEFSPTIRGHRPGVQTIGSKQKGRPCRTALSVVVSAAVTDLCVPGCLPSPSCGLCR